jgi:hypothetical protein
LRETPSAPKTPIVRLTHRRVHADLGRDTAYEKRIDMPIAQHEIEASLMKCFLPSLSITYRAKSFSRQVIFKNCATE